MTASREPAGGTRMPYRLKRREMLDDQESHPAGRRDSPEQLRDGLKSACGSANSHYRERLSGGFVCGTGCHCCSCDEVRSSFIRRNLVA